MPRRMSAFEIYMRTGRRVAQEFEAPEVKFNPWHDPEDGRFTFAGRGRHYGGGHTQSNSGGSAHSRPPSAKRTATGSRLAQSEPKRVPGPNQDSATYVGKLRQAVERMRQEVRATRKIPAVSEAFAQRYKRHMVGKEGRSHDVYPDNLGRPTVGIGHLVVPRDRLKLGDRISDAQIEGFWAQDSTEAIQAAAQQMRQAGITDPEFFVALAEVNFQLGSAWTQDHEKTWALVLRGDYEAAAKEAAKSLWYKQTPDRVEAFQKALRALSSRLRSKIR